ncbi:MAG: vitamin K epoxide reductase family protein, partial [Actinomycetota bacterium]|nr:vitamin K epoxide reductase family protein [Actinomycetota bacterium]
YQLGYIDYAVDPFFGEDTVRILDSDVSRAWPISDAGLGVFAYSLEALMGYMGGTSRWRTMPWMVTFFGILVVPLGAVSIFLVIMQPVAVGAWSTIALITAAAMLVMIPLTLDEVVAMGQFVLRRRREGRSLWRTFIYGDTVEGGGPDERSPSFPAPPRRALAASVWGVTLPWTLLVSAGIGMWLMAAPALLGTTSTAADSDHLVGALVVCVALIATAEVGRALRFLNMAFGAWLLVAPWMLEGASTGTIVSDGVAGIALMALTLPRGQVVESYGGAERFIR